jgi:hypothetical protein
VTSDRNSYQYLTTAAVSLSTELLCIYGEDHEMQRFVVLQSPYYAKSSTVEIHIDHFIAIILLNYDEIVNCD